MLLVDSWETIPSSMDNNDKKKGRDANDTNKGPINASRSVKLRTGKDAPKSGGWFGKPKPAATKQSPTPSTPVIGLVVTSSATAEEVAAEGLLIIKVVRGGPSAMAGILKGEFVQKLDGDWVTHQHVRFQDCIHSKCAGDSIYLQVYNEHTSSIRTVIVVLGSRSRPNSRTPTPRASKNDMDPVIGAGRRGSSASRRPSHSSRRSSVANDAVVHMV